MIFEEHDENYFQSLQKSKIVNKAKRSHELLEN